MSTFNPNFIEPSNLYKINLNSKNFEDTINSLIKEYPVNEIIETGTFNGLGSTSVFARTGLPVFSMDSCLSHHNQAKVNLASSSNVKLYFASSLPYKEMVEFIQKDDIYTSEEVRTRKITVDVWQDIDTDSSKRFYINEVGGFTDTQPQKENLLMELIDNDKKQLVFLDSAGGVGFLEFKKFMSLSQDRIKNKVLVLDDVSHVKHYRSVVFLKQNNYNVTVSEDQRFAYCTF
jgi:hypothetical protein